MTFLPIVARELRVASRSRATYWSRAAMALITIIAGVVVYVVSRDDPPHDLGMNLFQVLCWMAYIYCLTTGIRSTADCLSEEKRDGTLGLLFLTDLKGYDVVGGKLVATSLNSFFGLIAIFPVLAIPLLMGGVTNAELYRAALVLVNTFLLSLAIGMFMSSISTSPRKSMAATLSVILILVLGLPFCVYYPWNGYGHLARWSPRLTHALVLIIPNTSFMLMPAAEYPVARRDFWLSVGAVFGMSCVFLLLASLVVPRSWQDKPPGAKARRWRDTWHNWNYGDPAERLAFRKRLLEINAFFWLAGRARLKPAWVWAVLMVIACFWTWGAIENGNGWLNGGIFFFTAVIINTTLKIWVASEAGMRVGEDRRIGALELLLSTPLSVKEIVHGQVLALTRQFFAPVVAALLAEGVLLAASLQGGRANGDEIAVMSSFGVAYMFMLVADVVALGYVGMWVGLTAKNPFRATGVTVRRVAVLPWAIIGSIYLLLALFPSPMRSGTAEWQMFLALYCITGLAVDVWCGMKAFQRLHGEFREVATQRFDASRSLWRRLLGRGKSKFSVSAVPPPHGDMTR